MSRNPGGLTVSFAVVDLVPLVPVIVTVFLDRVGVVVTLKLTCLTPSGTVTVDGAWAIALSSAIVTTVPPAGAGPVNTTVALAEVPPIAMPELRPML